MSEPSPPDGTLMLRRPALPAGEAAEVARITEVTVEVVTEVAVVTETVLTSADPPALEVAAAEAQAGGAVALADADPALMTPAAEARSVPVLARAHALIEQLNQRLQLFVARDLPMLWFRVTRIGPAGLAGAAATLAALIVAAVTFFGARTANEALSAQLALAQGHPGAQPTGEPTVGKIVGSLPGRGDMPAVLGVVLEQAREANVSLDNGHYTYSAPKGGTVARYELEFPVKAEYPAVRNFINRTLSAVPAAGLDKLRIERKAVGDAIVNADIRFVIYVRPE